ncbi:uncharacterized protein LOC135375406 [Ornithodoros turicata]|uniref:uncharacterized protein LOC135375406 n=1 Tax=Ornithodoros turicata TaxID=34597 RepID=UPI00313960DC
MKVLLLLLVVIGLAAADALPWKGRRSADPVAAAYVAWLGRRSADPVAAAYVAWLGRRSADPEAAAQLPFLSSYRRSADPEAAAQLPFLSSYRRSADPVAAAYDVPAWGRRSADPAKRGIFDPPKVPIGNGLCYYLDVIIPC